MLRLLTLCLAGFVIVPGRALAYVRQDNDLDVRYIHRFPEIDYVLSSNNPSTEGWPENGQEVVWQAIVRNWSNTDRKDVAFRWQLDGAVRAEGTADIPAAGESVVEFPWIWTSDRHELTFVLDPTDEVAESSETNNELVLYTDAITIGLYVEHSIYDYFHERQHNFNVGSNSFDDWAQRGVRIFNEYLKDAVYPETPDGVLDRFRIDRITIVQDGALPLNKVVTLGNVTVTNPIPALIPNGDDRTVDIQFGFPVPLFGYDNYEAYDYTVTEWYNPFWFGGVAFHEMGHARYLIDVYGFSVDHGIDGNEIMIMEDGVPIVNSPYMPALSGGGGAFRLHASDMEGLMATRYEKLDRYSAAALNLISGHRAVAGNFNAPQNLGAFMNDFPDENALVVHDADGVALAGARISIYRSDPTGRIGGPYFKYYDGQPDLEFTANEEGIALLGPNPFGGDIIHGLGGSNAVLIVRVEHQARIGYGFLESTSFNLQFWGGNEELGRYELELNMVPSGATAFEEVPEHPAAVRLEANYPNPFRRSTAIPFELSEPGFVTLTVHDITGRRVGTLLDGKMLSAGRHRSRWDASALAGGIYVYRLRVNGMEKRAVLTHVR